MKFKKNVKKLMIKTKNKLIVYCFLLITNSQDQVIKNCYYVL